MVPMMVFGVVFLPFHVVTEVKKTDLLLGSGAGVLRFLRSF